MRATLFLLFLTLSNTRALYEADGDIFLLTEASFDKTVTDDKSVAMVEFFTPGCAQCQKLAPDYSRVAKSLKGIATVAAVDCEAEKKLCSKQRIQGFPSLKLYSGELTKNPYTGKLQRTEQDYTGPRTAGSIAKAIKAALPTHLETISSAADWEAFKETLSQGTPLVVLATTSKSTTPLYKALALRFRGRLRFAEVHSDTAEGLDELKADSFPQLTVLLPDGAKEKYEGELQVSLFAFPPPLRTFKPDPSAPLPPSPVSPFPIPCLVSAPRPRPIGLPSGPITSAAPSRRPCSQISWRSTPFL
mmetsp:Transcript_16906/g.40291  ORF Transcript_16906/g.40291 Transcript_16906/m.40291 type:complete len:303 (+) Transcript_16906:272-1180(+)